MTVAGNIGLPLTMARLSAAQRLPLIGRLVAGARAARASIASEVSEIARALEIEPLLGRKPGQLSGGQKQRVAVARAMVRHPSAFLMDEPLSNLDANLRVHMRSELTELHRRLGATLIYVTHDQTEAMTMSDRVAVMMNGRLLQVATPRAVYADPDSLEVAEFIGSPRINVLPARARLEGVEVCGAVLRLRHGAPLGTELRLGLRPEALSLAPRGVPGTLSATIRQVEHLGPEAIVQATLSDGAHRVVLRVDAAAGATLSPGQTTPLQIAADAALVFNAKGLRLRSGETPLRAVAAHG
jgi:multiple sugar transport system ATP-binding protein